MKLTDRAAFEQYVAEAQRRWAERTAGDRWVVSVGISECSIAKGARQTLDHLRLALEQAGIQAEVRQVGCAGWCWAEPYVEVQAPGAPPVIYQKITTDKVPELVDAMKRGTSRPIGRSASARISRSKVSHR